LLFRTYGASLYVIGAFALTSVDGSSLIPKVQEK
jgi:hypothetical protein